QTSQKQEHDINPKHDMTAHSESVPQLPRTSNDKISPGSHSAKTWNGRQQISQSVTNCCEGMEVSIWSSKLCPQKGQLMFSEHSMGSGESKKDRARVRSQSSSVTNQLNDF